MRLAVLLLLVSSCVKDDPDEVVTTTTTTTTTTTETGLPPDWAGTGVLAARTEAVPAGAPAWAAVQAEVVERDGQRLLAASGHASRIKNVALARTTAENRARAELAKWAKTETLHDSLVKETYFDPGSGDAFARVEMPVPAAWVPGQPL